MKLLRLLFVLLLLSSCGGGSNTSTTTESERFTAFLDREFVERLSQDMLTLNYTLKNPEAYGINRDTVTLGCFSPACFVIRAQEDKNTHNELLSFDRDLLTPAQQREYDALNSIMAMLHDEFLFYEDISLYIEELPVLLAEYKFYTQKDIDIYLLLLKDIQRVFDELELYLQEQSRRGLFMADGAADDMIQQMEAFIQMEPNILELSFDERLGEFEGLSEEDRLEYKTNNLDAVEEVFPAYEDLIAVLESLKGTGVSTPGTIDLPNGNAYYEQLVRQATGLSESVEEIGQQLDDAIDAIYTELNALYDQYPDLDDRLAALDYGDTDPQTILLDLQNKIATNFPELANVDYTIKYVPEALESSSTPAFYLIPPIDDATENVIYINNASILYDIYTILAHEGYPGHLYQINYSQDRVSPLHAYLGNDGYAEGWATYVEILSLGWRGWAPEIAKYKRLSEQLSWAVHARLDIGIHYEGWALEETPEKIDYVIINVDDTYDMVLKNPPTYYMTYFATCLKIEELKQKAQAALGNEFSEMEFHRAILDAGPSTFDIVEKAINNYIAVTQE